MLCPRLTKSRHINRHPDDRSENRAMTDDRLTEIEIKLAHAEQAINEMSDVLYAQQALLDKLDRGLTALRQRVSTVEGGTEGTSGDEKPPHY